MSAGRVLRALAPLALAAALGACSTFAELEPEPDLSLETVLKGGRQVTLADAQARYDEGRWEAAATALGHVLRVEPDNREAALLMGEALLRMDRPKQAVGYFSAASEAEAQSARALQGLGIANARLGDMDVAEARLREAVAKDPSLWRAHNALGQVHDARQRWEEAGAAYERALAVRPDSAIVHNNIGMSAMLRRDLETAVAEFREALRLDPGLTRAEANLRMALALRGAYADAFAGVDRRDVPDTLNNIGYAAMMRGDFTAAEAYFVRAIEASPTYHERAAANLERVRYLKSADRGVPVS